MKHIQEEGVSFVVVGKLRVVLTNTKIDDLPIEIQKLLEEYGDIVVNDLPNSLPPIRSISHHIDMIPGARLLNKSTYRTTPTENEEMRSQV
jgi:hypothetical protein